MNDWSINNCHHDQDSKGTIHSLRKHPVLDFAYEELDRLLAACGQYGANNNEGTNRYAIGTWSDCETALTAESAGNIWPWHVAGNRVYDEDAYSVIQNGHQVILTGKCERSTLYAVYHYIKARCQVEWIYPGEPAVSVAIRTQAVPDGTVFQPAFARRGFVYENLRDAPYLNLVVDWLAKNRINELFLTFSLWQYLRPTLEPELIKRGIRLTLGGHSMKFFTEKLHTIGLHENGSAPAFAGHKQLDYADKTWQESIVSEIVSYCSSVPMLHRVSLWPEDTAAKPQDEGQTSFLSLYVSFTERLQQAFKGRQMDVKVEHIAYNAGLAWHMLELDPGMKSSEEIDTLFAYWGRDYSQGWQEEDSCRSEELRAYRALQEWAQAAKDRRRELTIFEYYSDHYMLSYLFPFLSARIPEDLHTYRSLGINAIVNLVVPYPQAGDQYSWKWAQGANSYFFARSAWGDSPEAIERDYWCYYPEGERDRVKQVMERISPILQQLTGYNVPLFPYRVVDVKSATEEQSREIIHLLHELSDVVRSSIPAVEEVEGQAQVSYLQYFAHLYQASHSLAAEWEKNRGVGT